MNLFQYHTDFYLWMCFCALPTGGFVYTLTHKEGRPWAKKAIEDSDDKPNHIDLTFLAVLIAGWILCYGMFAILGLVMFEDKDLMHVFWQVFAAVGAFWGINKASTLAGYFKK